MNFSLPGIFILLHIVSAHNKSFSVRTTTLTLVFSPHQTDGQSVPGGGVRVRLHHDVLHVVRLVLPALLPGPGLVPAGHEEDTVALNLPPASGTLPAGTETVEIPRVGLSRGQSYQGKQSRVESPHVASL